MSRGVACGWMTGALIWMLGALGKHRFSKCGHPHSAEPTARHPTCDGGAVTRPESHDVATGTSPCRRCRREWHSCLKGCVSLCGCRCLCRPQSGMCGDAVSVRRGGHGTATAGAKGHGSGGGRAAHGGPLTRPLGGAMGAGGVLHHHPQCAPTGNGIGACSGCGMRAG